MKLLAALQRATKMITTDKHDQVLRHVLIQPAAGTLPGMVVAGDGAVWTQVTLDDDEEVTEAVINADQLRGLLTDAKKILKIDWATNGGGVRVSVQTKNNTVGEAEFQVLPRSQYPAPRPLPIKMDFVPADEGAMWPMVVHAANGGDPMTRHFGYVLANAHGLASTDGYRIALLQCPANWDGLLSPRLFEYWPKAVDIGVCVDVRCIYVRLGDDEIRTGVYAHSDSYPDPWRRACGLQPYKGARIIVPTKGLATACKQAADVSRGVEIRLKFRTNMIHVESISNDETQTYRTKLVGQGGERDTDFLVDGKMLHKALKALHTPMVLIGYRRYFDPVRVESGRFVECIWPMRETAGEAA